MIETLQIVGLDCIVVFGGIVVLAAALHLARAMLDALPLSRTRRTFVARMQPLAGATAIAIYTVIAAHWVLTFSDRQAWLAFALVFGVAAAASWSVLRNALEGVYLRVGRTFEIGDRIEIAGVEGRVHRLGARALVVETVDGRLAIIPYRTVANATIRREPFDQQSSFHVFRVAIPPRRSIPELKRAVHEAALLCHWSSTRRLPQVVATEDGQLEVTVFPVDGNHASEIERVVRDALT
jgi:small-conductance mechanosensitive channel